MRVRSCANCGKGEEGIDNLKTCTACVRWRGIAILTVKKHTVLTTKKNARSVQQSYIMRKLYIHTTSTKNDECPICIYDTFTIMSRRKKVSNMLLWVYVYAILLWVIKMALMIDIAHFVENSTIRNSGRYITINGWWNVCGCHNDAITHSIILVLLVWYWRRRHFLRETTQKCT